MLHKILNQNTVNISYSCVANIKSKINNYNKTILSKEALQTEVKTGIPDECLVSGHCLIKSLVYQATVSTSDGKVDQTLP